MFARLIGSAPEHERSAGASGTSVMLHATVVGVAIAFSAGRPAPTPTIPETLHLEFHPAPVRAPVGPPPPVREPPLACEPACLLPPVSLPPAPVAPPTTIPVSIPEPGPVAFGAPGAATAGRSSDPSAGEFTPTVDVPARPLPGNPEPVYPSLLRSVHVEGVILAHFVVDSTGRVDARSISFDSGDDALFDAAVRRALLAARYEPARAGGRAVAMRVQQTFAFRLTP